MFTSDFNEIPILCDDTSWLWLFIENAMKSQGLHYVKFASSQSLRQSWERIKNTPRIIVHWEGKHRLGGAIIEEILEINPTYDVGSNVIIITANPVREDVVYLSELGVKRLIRVRHKDTDIKKFADELKMHFAEDFTRDKMELGWQKLQRATDFVTKSTPPTRLERLYEAAQRLNTAQGGKPSARYLDVMATIADARGEAERAEKLWQEAIHLNPNFFRSYNKLSDFYQAKGKYQEALEILHRIHSLNKQRISRLVEFGNVHLRMNDHYKAEHYFKRALSEDQYSSGALNGLAEIRFHEGNLDEARQLLERTALAYRFASRLNDQGIELVKRNKFLEALDHYTRAQYVLPQREKGPRLFFNIALCYYRWGKIETAKEFTRIALVKEPNYKKAEQLMTKLESGKKAA